MSVSDPEDRRDLSPVGDVLDAVLGRFAGTSHMATLALLDRWEHVAGEDWRRSRPVKIDDRGVLVVEVDDGATATRLRYRTGTLTAAIEGELGAGVVRGVRLRVSRSKR